MSELLGGFAFFDNTSTIRVSQAVWLYEVIMSNSTSNAGLTLLLKDMKLHVNSEVSSPDLTWWELVSLVPQVALPPQVYSCYIDNAIWLHLSVYFSSL